MTVLRWHANALPALRNSGDTIDAHQARVMALCYSLANHLGMDMVRSDLLKAARHHDEPERVIGDVPGPAKRRFPRLAAALDEAEAEVRAELGLHWDLTLREAEVLDLCDKLDAWTWARQHGATGDEWDKAFDRLHGMADVLGAQDWLTLQTGVHIAASEES